MYKSTALPCPVPRLGALVITLPPTSWGLYRIDLGRCCIASRSGHWLGLGGHFCSLKLAIAKDSSTRWIRILSRCSVSCGSCSLESKSTLLPSDIRAIRKKKPDHPEHEFREPVLVILNQITCSSSRAHSVLARKLLIFVRFDHEIPNSLRT